MKRRCQWEDVSNGKVCTRCGLARFNDDPKDEDDEFCGHSLFIKGLLWAAWLVVVVTAVLTSMGIIFRVN